MPGDRVWLARHPPRPAAHLVLEHGPSEGPEAGEHEVELVQLLGRVGWCILLGKEALEQVQDHLDDRDLGHWSDLLKPDAKLVQAGGQVLVKEDHQVGLFRLHLAPLNPAAHHPGEDGEVLEDWATTLGPPGNPPLGERFHVILVLLPGDGAGPRP